MKISKRQQWLLVSSAAGALAAPLANIVVAAAWRRTSGEEIPDELARTNVNWKRLILFTATSALAVAFIQLAAQRGAASAWKGVTGRRPPTKRARVLT